MSVPLMFTYYYFNGAFLYNGYLGMDRGIQIQIHLNIILNIKINIVFYYVDIV